MGLGTVHLDYKPTDDREVVCLELWKGKGLLLVQKAGEERVRQRLGIYPASMHDVMLIFMITSKG
jgi:hypothetical protein